MDDTNEYEEYVEEMEPPEEQNRQRQQDVYQEPQSPKKTFRFPLMDVSNRKRRAITMRIMSDYPYRIIYKKDRQTRR
mgnify:CR=1 FL=1